MKIHLLGHFDQMVMLNFLSVQMIWPPSQSRSGPYHPPNFQFLNEGDLDISFPISSQLRICGKNKGSRICGASSRGSSGCAQTDHCHLRHRTSRVYLKRKKKAPPSLPASQSKSQLTRSRPMNGAHCAGGVRGSPWERSALQDSSLGHIMHSSKP